MGIACRFYSCVDMVVMPGVPVVQFQQLGEPRRLETSLRYCSMEVVCSCCTDMDYGGGGADSVVGRAW